MLKLHSFICTLVLLVTFSLSTLAQDRYWVRASVGNAMYNSTWRYNNGLVERPIEDMATAQFFNLHFEKNYQNGFSMGTALQINSFGSQSDTSGLSNGISWRLGLSISASVLRRDRFRLFIQSQPSFAWYTINTHINTADASILKASGPQYNLGLGGQYYLNDKWGLFGLGGYHVYAYSSKETFGRRPLVNFDINSLAIDHLGWEFSAGMVYRIRG